MQRKLELVLDHLGIAAPENLEVIRHLRNGRTIEAVRAYRKQTGASLIEAKQAVDSIAAGLRLFPDHEPIERDYYRRTGIFPMMHTIVAPRDLLVANPGLGRAVYRAFLQAKDAAAEQNRQHRRLYQVHHMLPWTNALFERNDGLMPYDWWPYGISANRDGLDTYLRYHHQQGLSARRWTIEEIFVPDLLGT